MVDILDAKFMRGKDRSKNRETDRERPRESQTCVFVNEVSRTREVMAALLRVLR